MSHRFLSFVSGAGGELVTRRKISNSSFLIQHPVGDLPSARASRCRISSCWRTERMAYCVCHKQGNLFVRAISYKPSAISSGCPRDE